ncbi:MAG TPA: hypothetical protein PK661_08620, partial [Syntrophorhabdaceae bacterium]|nr:hypothetical protein [Syntrophorhabdaceae bacterium]
DDIPIASRVIALCDTYDAMTSSRPYRNAMQKQDALKEIQRCSKSQFDPSIVECFLPMMESGDHDKG